jgi:hypothetical protein
MEVYITLPDAYSGAFDLMPMYVDDDDNDFWNVEQIKFTCKYCDKELMVMYNCLVPFEGHFDVRCPKCERRLNKKEDFTMYGWEQDCNCKKKFDDPEKLV